MIKSSNWHKKIDTLYKIINEIHILFTRERQTDISLKAAGCFISYFGWVWAVCELIRNIDFIIDYKDRLSPVSECVEGEVFLAPSPAADYRTTNQMWDLDKGPMRSQTEIRLGAPGTHPACLQCGFCTGAWSLEIGTWQVGKSAFKIKFSPPQSMWFYNIKRFMFIWSVCTTSVWGTWNC